MYYDQYGQEYRAATVQKDEQLVWTQVEDGDGSSYDYVLVIIKKDRLLSEPPGTHKLDQSIVNAREELNKLKEQKNVAARELAEAEKASAERMEALKKHNGLELLDDFIAGKITQSSISYFIPKPIAVDNITVGPTRQMLSFLACRFIPK